MRRWLLPEHIEDILPAEARTVERLRRAILDLFATHGYELVQPPLLEYTESLLSGTGRDLDLATFRLADRLSGRQLGVRADHTPQVARIDAHLLNREGVPRLAYCGSVLHTLPAGMTTTREPIQISHPEHGSETLQRRRYSPGNRVRKIGHRQDSCGSLFCSLGRLSSRQLERKSDPLPFPLHHPHVRSAGLVPKSEISTGVGL